MRMKPSENAPDFQQPANSLLKLLQHSIEFCFQPAGQLLIDWCVTGLSFCIKNAWHRNIDGSRYWLSFGRSSFARRPRRCFPLFNEHLKLQQRGLQYRWIDRIAIVRSEQFLEIIRRLEHTAD